MAPLEPWEKVLVSEEFFETVHGRLTCIDCHNGQQSPDKETAHTGMITNPDQNGQAQCGFCHGDKTANFDTSLHSNLAGYWTALDTRSVPENHPALETAFNNHCSSCHTTCGDCHISQPDSVGGGLLDGHTFVKTPPMTRTCTACHGSRVGAEYLGKHEGIPGDVHFRQGRMKCTDCHTGEEMHATPVENSSHRYAGEEMPECKTCHAQVGASSDPVKQHTIHQDKLSCQVCHSVSYTSCNGCHVAISDKTGNPFFETDATYMTFFIGRNTRQSDERPYEYVVVRHVPVAEDSFEYYGENLLSNFDALPTWMYATPHNIQRVTPQNQSCNSCHGNPALFLTEDKVNPDEIEANHPVIVEEIPPAMP